MALTLNDALDDLTAGNITLISGIQAQLTREIYYTPYTNIVNFQQFVPIVYYNIIEKTLAISNTPSISFTQDDIFTADDWVVLNEELVV